MYNPFTFIPLWIRKWTDGTRFDIVKLVCSSLLFVLSVYVLIKWNTVPAIIDTLETNTYMGIREGKACYDVRIVHPYYNFSNLYKNKAYYNIGFLGTCDQDSNVSLKYTRETDSLISIMRKNDMEVVTDSAIMMCHVKLKMFVTKFHTKSQNERIERVDSNSIKILGRTYNETRDTAWACGDWLAVFNKHVPGNQKDYSFSSKSDITLSMNGLINWFRLEDISQCYYKLNIKSFGNWDEIKNLNIGFGGAVRFLQINPVPDMIDDSSVQYSDKWKLLHIQCHGLTLYCQQMEAVGLQSVRVYILSAFATFFLGISLKILLEVIWRFCKKRIDTN